MGTDGSLRPLRVPGGLGGSNEANRQGSARAAAAFDEEFARWTGLIEAVRRDLGMTASQREAAVRSLIEQQAAAARGIMRRVREDERQKERAYWRAVRRRIQPSIAMG
jgi:hypothetical protein